MTEPSEDVLESVLQWITRSVFEGLSSPMTSQSESLMQELITLVDADIDALDHVEEVGLQYK